MTKAALIADIGGTNARFGIVDKNGVRDLHFLKCSEYASLVDAVEAYYALINIKQRPDIGVIAVAGPVLGDQVSFTNIPWSFSVSATKTALGFKAFEAMNDFKAVGLAVDGIDQKFVRQFGADTKPMHGQAIGVIGPGTGLGVASLIWAGDHYICQPGEGGNTTVPATTQREFDLFQALHTRYRHISAERVCSGKGLENLYYAIKHVDGKDHLPNLGAEEISRKAMSGECLMCAEALDLMLGFLGRVAGNLALTLNAHGGIYIAGGIPTKLGEAFYASRFLEEFQAKGRFQEYMKHIPTFVIQHDAIGLIGLENYAKRQLGVL